MTFVIFISILNFNDRLLFVNYSIMFLLFHILCRRQVLSVSHPNMNIDTRIMFIGAAVYLKNVTFQQKELGEIFRWEVAYESLDTWSHEIEKYLSEYCDKQESRHRF